MAAATVSGSGPGSADRSLPLKNIQGLMKITTGDGRLLFHADDNAVSTNFGLCILEFNASEIESNTFITDKNNGNFVIGLTVYDNTKEMILPDYAKINNENHLEINFDSFEPMSGIWTLAFLGVK